jgi:hypothetical protein
VIKGTKLDFYYVASPSPFDHRQITWPIYTLNPQTAGVPTTFENDCRLEEGLWLARWLGLRFGGLS